MRGLLQNFLFLQQASLRPVSFHTEDMINVVFAGIRDVINEYGIILDFIHTNILCDEQRMEFVFSHQRIIFQHAHLGKVRQLRDRLQNFFEIFQREDFPLVSCSMLQTPETHCAPR